MGKTILFFGCRNEEKDYYYGKEFEEYEREGGLILHVAFSRQNEEKKTYVQHLFNQFQNDVWNVLHIQRGSFFLSG